MAARIILLQPPIARMSPEGRDRWLGRVPNRLMPASDRRNVVELWRAKLDRAQEEYCRALRRSQESAAVDGFAAAMEAVHRAMAAPPKDQG